MHPLFAPLEEAMAAPDGYQRKRMNIQDLLQVVAQLSTGFGHHERSLSSVSCMRFRHNMIQHISL